MRGRDFHGHPEVLMGKKTSPCGRKDKHVEVWDTGNGFLFLGTSDAEQSRRVLDDYVDNAREYRFASFPGGTEHEGRYVCRVWLTADPGGEWDGD